MKKKNNKILVLKGPYLKASLTKHIWKSIHSVYDKIKKLFFEVYDTDSPVAEVWPFNIYFER